MKELFVAASGSDETGNGGAGAPYQTLARAVRQARDCKDSVEIRMHGGSYFLAEPLTLTPEDSGLSIRACEGENPELSGAIVLGTPDWQPYPQNPAIRQCALRPGMKLDRLFVNRKEQTLARFPNFTQGVLPLGGVATRAQIKERVAGYKNPAGGYLRAIHPAGWGGVSYKITGKDSGSKLGLSYFWMGDNNRGSGMRDEVVIENVFEELDAPGEWFYDDENGMLFLWPEADTDLSGAVIEASVNTQLIRMKGNIGQPVRDVTLDGLRFFGTKRTLFTVNEPGMAYVPLLRGDWCVVRAGAVYLDCCESIRVENSDFSSLGGNGIFMSGYQKENAVKGCEFFNIGATAVQVCGLPEAVWNPSFWPNDLYPDLPVHLTSVEHPEKTGPKSEAYPRDIVIENCHMQKVGVFEKQSAGVNLSVSSRVKILHCTIHESARSDININDGSFGGHEIAYNDIFDAQRETTDHGPFNSWGRDRFWSIPRYNASGEAGRAIRFYQTPSGTFDLSLLDAYQTTAIHDNRFHHAANAPHTWGIDLDDGSSNYDIYNNLCLGLGVKLREGFGRHVHNNILIDGQVQIHVPYEDARDRVESNLIVNTTPYGFAGTEGKRLRETGDVIDRNWLVARADALKLPRFYSKGSWDAYALRDRDPGFADPLQMDYTVTNQSAMELVGFVNFPMERFGKPGCPHRPPVYFPTVHADDEGARAEKWRGARLLDMSNAIRSSTAYGRDTGVYLAEVASRSKAYRIGLRERDVIMAFDGCNIDTCGELLGLLKQFRRKTVSLRIHRQNEAQELLVRIP